MITYHKIQYLPRSNFYHFILILDLKKTIMIQKKKNLTLLGNYQFSDKNNNNENVNKINSHPFKN